jgi:hypothetical protein
VGIGLRDPRSQKRDLGHPSILTDAVSRIEQGSVLGMKKGEEFGLLFALMRLGFFLVFGSVLRKPGLVSMQEGKCVFDVLFCGPIGGAFTVVRYQVLEFWTALNIHR